MRECALRELEEETGLDLDKWERSSLLRTGFTLPDEAQVTYRIKQKLVHVFIVEDLEGELER